MNAWAGPVCAFLSSVTWALGSSGYAAMTRHYSAFSVNFARAMVAFPLFLIAVFVASGGWQGGAEAFSQLTLPHLGWLTLSILSSYGIGDALFYWSTASLGIPGALAIASSYPILTTIAGAWFFGEPVSATQFLGLIVAVSGVVLVILSGRSSAIEISPEPGEPLVASPSRNRRLAIGVMLALLCSVCWGINTFAVSRAGKGLDGFVANAIRMAVALVLCFALSRVAKRSPALDQTKLQADRLLLPASQFRRSLWLFVIEGFGGSFLFLYGLSHSPLVAGATLVSLAPVLAVPVSVALGFEKLSWMRTAGVACAVLGICLLVAK